MITCPDCGYENIDGADTCDSCEASLSDLHMPTPATDVEQSLLTDRVSVLQPKEPISVTPDTSLGDTLKLLVDKSIGCLLVVDDQKKLVGIFSERDALLRVGAEVDAHSDRPVSDFMTPNPQSLAADVKVAFAVHRMDLGGYRHVPIVDGDGAVTGIISVRDILGYLTNKMAGAGA